MRAPWKRAMSVPEEQFQGKSRGKKKPWSKKKKGGKNQGSKGENGENEKTGEPHLRQAKNTIRGRKRPSRPQKGGTGKGQRRGKNRDGN